MTKRARPYIYHVLTGAVWILAHIIFLIMAIPSAILILPFCLPTEDLQTNLDHRERWVHWFAWRPVFVEGKPVWLRVVFRHAIMIGPDTATWTYKLSRDGRRP